MADNGLGARVDVRVTLLYSMAHDIQKKLNKLCCIYARSAACDAAYSKRFGVMAHRGFRQERSRAVLIEVVIIMHLRGADGGNCFSTSAVYVAAIVRMRVLN